MDSFGSRDQPKNPNFRQPTLHVNTSQPPAYDSLQPSRSYRNTTLARHDGVGISTHERWEGQQGANAQPDDGVQRLRSPASPARSDAGNDALRPGTSDSGNHGHIPILLQVGNPTSPEHGRREALTSRVSGPFDFPQGAGPPPSPLPESASNAPAASKARESRLRSKYYVDNNEARAKSASSSLLHSPVPSHASHKRVPSSPYLQQQFDTSYHGYEPDIERVKTRGSRQKNARISASAASQKSSILRTVSKLGSTFRPLSSKDPSKYERLEDDRAESAIALGSLRKSAVNDHNDEYPVVEYGVDISSFEGPAEFNQRRARRASTRRRAQPTSAAESKQEQNGELTGGLGQGLDNVVETTLTVPDEVAGQDRFSATSPLWKKSLRRPSPGPAARRAGQKFAEKTGHVVVVDEPPAMDISHLEGGGQLDHQAADLRLIAKDGVKQSYYFPPDPEMPDWKPFTMQWWYVTLLVAIAFAFAGITEYLVQKSIKSGPQVGLLHFRNPADVSRLDWFTWKYLPTMVLLFYGIMWQAVDFECRRLEPYYQLSRREGALAAESLNMDYVTFFSYLIPFKALHYKQWAVVLSSFSTIFASALIPILSNGALNVNPDRKERKASNIKWITFDLVWSRVMEAALLLVAIAGILLTFQLRRKSGLQSDPQGVAGVAALATKSHILNDFRGLDKSSHSDIHRQLKRRRYILHKSAIWQGEYVRQTGTGKDFDDVKPQNPHPLALQPWVGLTYLSSLILFTGLIPILEFTGANIVTEEANWFITLLAILLKLAWTNLETAVRMIEPFYILSLRHAPAKVLRLEYTGTIPIWFPCRALLDGRFLVAAVGFGSILVEILTVVVSSFNVDGNQFVENKKDATPSQHPRSTPLMLRADDDRTDAERAKDLATNASNADTAETLASFWTSFVLAELIPLILAAIAATVYLRRRHAFLPRQPATIASILAFIHQSTMLPDFVSKSDRDGSTWSDASSDETDARRHQNHQNRRRRRRRRRGSSLSGASDRNGSTAAFRPGELLDTLTSRISYLHGPSSTSLPSQLRRRRKRKNNRKHGVAEVDVAEATVQLLGREGRTYGLGWYTGRDGHTHLGINEEELLAPYKHGEDYTLGDLREGPGGWEML